MARIRARTDTCGLTLARDAASVAFLFHPDCDRRPRRLTGSADLALCAHRSRCCDAPTNRALAGSRHRGWWPRAGYRRWGISPRPENAAGGARCERTASAEMLGTRRLGGCHFGYRQAMRGMTMLRRTTGVL